MHKTRGLELQEDLRDDHGCHFVGDDGLGLAVVEPQGLEGVDAEGALVLHAAVARCPALQGGCRDCLLRRTGGRTHNPWAAAPERGGGRENKEEGGRGRRNFIIFFFQLLPFHEGKIPGGCRAPPPLPTAGEERSISEEKCQPCKGFSSSLPAPFIWEGLDPEQPKSGAEDVAGGKAKHWIQPPPNLLTQQMAQQRDTAAQPFASPSAFPVPVNQLQGPSPGGKRLNCE